MKLETRWIAVVLPAVLALAAAGVLQATAGAEEAGAPVTVFTAEGPQGKVWVNVDLTRQRAGEDFIPLVVAIQNMGQKPVTVNRDSLRLLGSEGGAVPMASIEEIRKEYRKFNFDVRTVKAQGMPFGTRLSREFLVPSSFFPSMADGGNIKRDVVVLPPSYWMVDLVYFRRPEGLAEGRDLILQVQPEGWEEPVELRFHL